MTTTGYSDNFNRTVASGLGVATSGQTYTLIGTASQFSVTPSVASIAISSAGDKFGYVDRQTADIDITAQVAISAIPATNLATVGFMSKFATASNYYSGTLMVQTLGIMSLRFSKVIAGGLSTISTTLLGSYTAGTFYNLRYACFWSNALQTNVMQLKAWLVGVAEPGGWQATAFDSGITQYTSGTNAGIFGRDESSSVGSITTRYQNVVARSYSLPEPGTADTMCADSAVAYPKRPVLQSLALAADSAMATIDPLTSLAGSFPRVRVSRSNYAMDTNSGANAQPVIYDTTEFNVGTSTNLGYNSTDLLLPLGIWLLTFEIQMVEQATNFLFAVLGGGNISGSSEVMFRSNAVQLNDQGVGGCAHASMTVISASSAIPINCNVGIFTDNTGTAGPFNVKYAALSAVKISDYFA